MTDNFEIVKGDYGRTYRGTIANANLTDCTAKLYLWDSTRAIKVIDGGTCSVSLSSTTTLVDYVVTASDFDDVTAGTYYGLIKFEKTGVVERTIRFSWKVYEKEP